MTEPGPEPQLDELLATRSAVVAPSGLALGPLRARLGDFARYALVDRGSYEYLDAPALPPDVLAPLIGRFAGAPRRCVESRVLRLRPGDFVLARHDRIRERGMLECVVDLSPAPVPGAELHYRQHGQVFVRVPCEPGLAALVPRGPTVTCNHTYVSKLREGAEVLRWITLFA